MTEAPPSASAYGPAMIGLESGMLVQHASLGLGKVVAVEPNAVHVVFAAEGARVATKLRLPAALSFLAPPATSNAWLSSLSGFTLDAKTGRYGRGSTWLSHPEAVARFTEVFPLAFEDPAYAAPEKGRGGRAARWRRAHAEFVAAFGDGQGERLLSAGDVADLVARAARIERIVSPIVRDAGRTPFEAARADPTLARGFFTALLDLLSADAPDRARFDALAASVAALAPAGATPEAGWPVITLLPFIARPDVHMLLRPHVVCEGAQRLGLELVYEPAPGWATYASLLDATRQLLERLRPLGARDHADVEAFMHVALAAPARPKPEARAKAAAAARAEVAAEEEPNGDAGAGDERADDAEPED
jgi:hypothetical protein